MNCQNILSPSVRPETNAEIRAVNDRRVLPLEILAKSRRDKHKIAT